MQQRDTHKRFEFSQCLRDLSKMHPHDINPECLCGLDVAIPASIQQKHKNCKAHIPISSRKATCSGRIPILSKAY